VFELPEGWGIQLPLVVVVTPNSYFIPGKGLEGLESQGGDSLGIKLSSREAIGCL